MTATWATITPVHSPPKRVPPLPAPACRSRACSPRVTLSAGSTPAIHRAEHREHRRRRASSRATGRRGTRTGAAPSTLSSTPSPQRSPSPAAASPSHRGDAAQHQRLGEELHRRCGRGSRPARCAPRSRPRASPSARTAARPRCRRPAPGTSAATRLTEYSPARSAQPTRKGKIDSAYGMTSGRRCRCVSGKSAAARRPSVASSARASSSVAPGASRPNSRDRAAPRRGDGPARSAAAAPRARARPGRRSPPASRPPPCCGVPAQAHRPPHHAGIAAEAPPPHVVPDHDHRGRPGPLVRVHSARPSSGATRATRNAEALISATATGSVEAVPGGSGCAPPCRKAPSCSHRCAAPRARRRSRAAAGARRGSPPRPRCGSPRRGRPRRAGARVRELRHQLEGGRAHRDGERHGQPAHQREPRVLDQHARAELEVQRQAAHPRQPARVAHLLLVPLHPAEGDRRPPPRLRAGPAPPRAPGAPASISR